MTTLQKHEKYQQAVQEINAILKDETNMILKMSTINCILKSNLSYYFWVGFYCVNNKELIVGPYQGTLGCLHISFERGVFSKALAAAQEAMGFIGKKAKAGEMNIVLQNCMDFLNLSSHIVVAWRLMESAWIADEKMESAQSDAEKEYLESKIVDFKIYCSHYLVQSIALAKTITSLDQDITKYKV